MTITQGGITTTKTSDRQDTGAERAGRIVAEDPRCMTPHQLAERCAEDVLVGMDVDRSAVTDLVVGASVHVDPGWALAAEQQTLGGDVQDQHVGAVPEAQPRSAERATDGCRVRWAEPLLAKHSAKLAR